MCSPSLLWGWKTSLELEIRHVLFLMPYFQAAFLLRRTGMVGVAFRTCNICASKYHMLLNLCCPLLIRRMTTKPIVW